MSRKLRTKAEVFSQVSQYFRYLPNSADQREFVNQELLSKMFFFQVTNLTYEEFLSAYHAYPNVLADFQANSLVDYNLEINVDSPHLTSTLIRDANGDLSRAFLKFRIPIRVTAPRFTRNCVTDETLYVDLDVYTTDPKSPNQSSSGNDYPTIQLVMHSAELAKDFPQRPSLHTDHFFDRDAVHYARTLRTAVYSVVRDYVEHIRPEIFNGKPRIDC